MTTPTILAGLFSAELRATLSPVLMDEVVARNALPNYDYGSCASHDFCDANIVMADAFEQATGRPVWLPCDAEDGACTEAELDADLALWNAAWDIAKASGFALVAQDDRT